MKQLILIAAMALLVTACQRPAGSSDVVLVDLDSVARALGRDDVIEQQLQSANENLSGQVMQLASNLKAQLDEQQQLLGEKPTDEAQANFQSRLADANKQLTQTQQLARQKAAEFRAKVIADFVLEVRPVAEEIARKRGASVVLTAAAPMVWFEPSVDITGDVVAAMRSKGAAAAPAASPAPAEPATEPAADAGSAEQG